VADVTEYAHPQLTTEPVHWNRHPDGVVTLTLGRAERLNGLDNSLLEGIAEALRVCASSPEIRAVVLTGNGRGFCAGADLSAERIPADPLIRLRAKFHPAMQALASLDKPVVCAINGVVAGAGLTLVCAADIRIASASARFVPAFSKIGLVPDSGVSFFVPRLIGWGRTYEWLALSDEIDAARACAWGLVNEVVAADGLLDRAIAMAGRIARMPGLAPQLTKQLLRRSMTATLAEQLEHEVELQGAALAAPDQARARDEAVRRLRDGIAVRRGGAGE